MSEPNDRTPLLASGDENLLRAAATGEGLVPVTEALLSRVGERVAEEQAKLDNLQAAWDAIPYETRLTAAQYVIQKIAEHGQNPGTFRYLIYDRLGFGTDAYVPLYMAGGMEITNGYPADPIPAGEAR